MRQPLRRLKLCRNRRSEEHNYPRDRKRAKRFHNGRVSCGTAPDVVVALAPGPNSVDLPDRQVEAIQTAWSARPGEDYITKQDLIEATGQQDSSRALSRAVYALRSPYGRAGLAFLSVGLFLIAVTVIPDHIQDPPLRFAAVCQPSADCS